MAKFILTNHVPQLKAAGLYPGSTVDDANTPISVANIQQLGGVLWPAGDPYVAAAALNAVNARRFAGANEETMQAIVHGGVQQSMLSGGGTVVGTDATARSSASAAQSSANTAETDAQTGIANAAISANLVYGGGEDGACVFDGVNVFGFATLSGSTYTLNSDCFLADGSSTAIGVTVKTNGFHLFCNGTLTNNGTILADGNDAVGATAGAATHAGTLGISTAGGNGHAGVGTGSNGSNQANTLGDSDLGSPAGGNGGAGGAQAGGTGGTYVNNPLNGGAHYLIPMISGYLLNSASGGNQASLAIIGGGAGGAGGGADNAGATGGGGGGGGGVMLLAVYNLVNNGTIRAKGGNGAAGTGSAGNAGGGGGGGGGIVLSVSRFRSGTGTITAPKGTGGAKFGASGVVGSDGSDGQVHRHAA